MVAQYLVLHKCRGEPTFDVAQKLQIGNEEGWIIPSSGWRCYPWQAWPFSDLAYVNNDLTELGDMPANAIDMYAHEETAINSTFSASSILKHILKPLRRI